MDRETTIGGRPPRRLRSIVGWFLAAGAVLGGLALAGLTCVGAGAAPPAPVANHAFRAAPRADAPAVVWAVGDGADGSDAARAVAERIAADRPDRVLYLGDVYDDGSADEFREHYAGVYGALADVTAPTPGNSRLARAPGRL